MPTKRLTRSAAVARRTATTATRAHETMTAAASVIAARSEMAALSYTNPSAETDAEMGLMVSEKVAAFSEAGAAMAVGAADLANRSAVYATREAAAASSGLAQLARARSPLEFLNVQSRLVADFFGRGLAYGLGLNAIAARTGDRALAPVHRAVTANDRRLKDRAK